MSEILYGIKKVVITELDPATGLAKAGATPFNIVTAEEAEVDPVVSNGEEKVLRDDEKILAVARTEDLLYGFNVKLKDAKFDFDVASLIEGGVVRKTGEVIEGYDAPKLADGSTKIKPFKMDVYVANYEGDEIKDYVRITFNKCSGKFSKLQFKKDFFAPEFEIKARENTKADLTVRSIDIVPSLPA